MPVEPGSRRRPWLALGLFVAGTVIGAPQALAEPPQKYPAAHLKLAGELLEAAGGRQSFEAAMRQVMQAQGERLDALAARFPVGSPDYLAVQDYAAKIKALIADRLTWQRLRSRYQQMYAETFSDAEMRKLIAFYHSDTGALVREKMPELAAKASLLVSEDIAAMMPEIQALAQQLQQRLQADHERH